MPKDKQMVRDITGHSVKLLKSNQIYLHDDLL